MTEEENIIRMAREVGVHPEYTPGMLEMLTSFAALAAAAEREAVLHILKGIDRTETESSDGWWETSAGAAFGAGILDSIRARGEPK